VERLGLPATIGVPHCAAQVSQHLEGVRVPLCGKVQRRGLIHHGNDPVLQGQRLVGDGALGGVGQVFAGQGSRCAKAAPARQVGIQFGDVLGGGDYIDVVAHGNHARHPGVHHFLGQRAISPYLAMGVGVGDRHGRCIVPLGVGRAAGIEHQHGHLGFIEQFAKLRPTD
jgi:hypothetical protein